MRRKKKTARDRKEGRNKSRLRTQLSIQTISIDGDENEMIQILRPMKNWGNFYPSNVFS